ncbi:Vesicle transport through interaction with t-SNAREs -like protein 1A [Takifugu flavidus]|uniref:Vesicle transport through interaction with t-SNAREs-like protein 1A n=1 Tax=Takifugu flavidus TaxID=433684 RepID=A0A5C6PTU5_9TELE|nr:Vesicle transport through interaction with t-SNAREs -like protein 1A [Takifugu flavidus]
MSSDFEAYEQDFGTITAEITNKIGRIPKLSGEEKTQLVLNVDKQLEEVRELLEQMDLEAREIPIQSRAMYNSRLKSYKQEVEKLEKDFAQSLPSNPTPYWLPMGVFPLTCFLILTFTPGFEVFIPPVDNLSNRHPVDVYQYISWSFF